MYQKRGFEILPISALEKVRGDCRPQLYEDKNSALFGERFGFQVAFRCIGYGMFDIAYTLEGVDAEHTDVYLVREVPCTYPVAADSDDYILTDSSCAMPDLLAPISQAGIVARDGYWQSFYIRFHDLQPGEYAIKFSLFDGNKELLGSVNYTLCILPQKLPQNDLICTYWIHYDSLAEYYHLPLFSEAYNQILRSFLCDAVDHGLNMLLTPLFTPPLDTGIGKERMTVQLVDVKKTGDAYEFDFTRLGWFMNFAQGCGVQRFEMSHLFTQWGAKAAPKIIATVDGQEKRIFGWDTEALSPEYTAFLTAFLPCLRTWLIENGYYERCCFHLSDEPNDSTLQHYKACHALVKGCLPGAKFADAMSHYEYYEHGLSDMPFVALNATETFIEKGIKNYFVYYCTTQRNKFLSNRFMSMPLERTRILGIQMYRNDVRGFLHWGYNYYYSFLSREAINPFAVTDCMGRYQSGDAFIVYPGNTGVWGSIRNEAFYQGLQDYCALKLLEEKIGREKVCAFLDENGIAENFSDYPKNAGWLISLRKKINERITEK